GVYQGLANQQIDIEQASLLVNHFKALAKEPFIKESVAPDIGTYYLGFNLDVPPFNDPAFREAMAYTINYQEVIDTLFQGYAEIGNGFIAPANTIWHDQNLKTFTYDPDKAKQILEKAGYTWSDGKLYMPSSLATGS